MCQRRLDVNKSGKGNLLVAHINARMRIFGDCVQTMRRRCRQFRNKCFGYNFSHVNRSWKCALYCISSSLSKTVIAEAVVQVSRVDVQYVDKRMFFKSCRRSVKLWDRPQECD